MNNHQDRTDIPPDVKQRLEERKGRVEGDHIYDTGLEPASSPEKVRGVSIE